MAGKIQLGSFSMEWGAQKSAYGPGEGYTYDLKGTQAIQDILGSNDNFSDEVVTEKRALGLATVWSCLNVRSRTMASLPCNVMIEENGEKRVLTDHPVYWLLSQQPNKYMSAANMALTSMIHSDGWGNSVLGINRDSRNRPSSFDLICPGEWSCVKYQGEAWYKINGEMYPSSEVLHYRWFSLDGLMGISPIRQNQITMGKGFKQARYSATALGDRPPGFLTYEGNLTPEQRALNQKSWQEDRRAGKVPLLSGKWGYNTTMIAPGDAEYIQTADLNDQQICGIYQMPPAFVQNYQRMTWNNAEQVDLIYAKHTITPICTVIEKENNMKLFTAKEQKSIYTKHNMNGLLRGDAAARAAFYTAMRNIGGMNGNEIRDREDLNQYEGGDIFTVQGANVPVDQLRDFYTSKVAPTAQPINGQKNGKYYEFN